MFLLAAASLSSVAFAQQKSNSQNVLVGESVDDEQDTEEQIDECRRYSVEDLFCCCYAPFFWQAIQIRYPEYANYNHALYAMFGGND